DPPAALGAPGAGAVPRAADDAPAEAAGLDRTVARTHVARELEREIRAAHAVEQGPPGAGVMGIHGLRNTPSRGKLATPVERFDRHQALEREAREIGRAHV